METDASANTQTQQTMPNYFSVLQHAFIYLIANWLQFKEVTAV